MKKNSNIGLRSVVVGRASYQHVSQRIDNPSIRPMKEKESFGRRIFYARMKMNMSRKQFADFCNLQRLEGDSTKITMQDLYNYEHEKCVAKTNKQALIQKTLGVNVDYFEGSTSKKYQFNLAQKRAEAFLAAIKKR